VRCGYFLNDCGELEEGAILEGKALNENKSRGEKKVRRLTERKGGGACEGMTGIVENNGEVQQVKGP